MTRQSEFGGDLSPYYSDASVKDISDDMNGCIHGPVDGFLLKYFSKFDSVDKNDVFQTVAGAVGDHHLLPSATLSPEAFLRWFSTISSKQLDGARGTWHTSCSPASAPGGAARAAHLLLIHSPVSKPSSEPTWRHVEVIGQFCRDDSMEYRDGLLGLCGQAREVFASQPTRLFLHGLYIHGTLIELWVFDRSGMYGCDGFDIRSGYAQFLSVMLSYRLMTDKDLGKSSIIEDNEAGSYIKLEDTTVASPAELYLDGQPIARSRQLVGEGTTCYRAKKLGSNRWDYVVKFKWRLARDDREEELLKLVTEKRVWGVVSLIQHKYLDSTANLRQGLRFRGYRRFQIQQQHWVDECFEGTRLEAQETSCDVKGIVEDTEEIGKSFEDRIFTCVVTSPAGRPLRTFKTLLELLQVFRDAIKGHRSLFQDAKILHQDVSVQNIIITDAQSEEDPRGILIDLDGAVDLTRPMTPGEVIGTRPFMAIGILKNRRHTFRHDLESFLYVFLWTILSNRSENPPRTSKLRQWSKGSWDESATQKTIDMDKVNFESILAEFPHEYSSVKPLAETLRQKLFPLERGTIWTGTNSAPEAVNELYDGIVSAFDEAIAFEIENGCDGASQR